MLFFGSNFIWKPLVHGQKSIQSPNNISKRTYQKAQKLIKTLKKELKKRPNNKALNLKVGKAYNLILQPDKALPYLKKSLDYDRPASYLELAKSYRLKKQYLDEIRILNLLIPKTNNFSQPIYLLGKALFNIGKHEEAISKYRQSIQISPRFEKPYWGMLEIYNSKKNYYESRIILLDMVKIFGDKSKYHTQLCKLYSIDSFFENSIKYCKQAIVLNSKIPDNHVYLGQTYKYLKEAKRAERTLTRAARSFRKSELAQQAAGELMEETENYEKAIKYFRHCKKINKENLRCQLGLGRVAFYLGKYKESNQAYYNACIIDRKSIVAEYKKQASLLRMDKKNKWYNKFTKEIRRCYNP